MTNLLAKGASASLGAPEAKSSVLVVERLYKGKDNHETVHRKHAKKRIIKKSDHPFPAKQNTRCGWDALPSGQETAKLNCAATVRKASASVGVPSH
jgi:hypothetical protein